MIPYFSLELNIIDFDGKREKKFVQKLKILAHSENHKLPKTYLLPYFQPLWAKII
jgi:hypothetical protein